MLRIPGHCPNRLYGEFVIHALHRHHPSEILHLVLTSEKISQRTHKRLDEPIDKGGELYVLEQ